MCVLDGGHLFPRSLRRAFNEETVWRIRVRVVKEVARVQAAFVGKLVIHSAQHIPSARGCIAFRNELASISIAKQRAVGQWQQGKHPGDLRIHGDRSGGQQSVTGRAGQRIGNGCGGQELINALKVCKPERAVLDDGASGGGAELMSPELRLIASVEEVPGIQRAVSSEIENGSMDFVRA